ncbi:uncharacterized protein BO80DRAFT_470879 [Aspergillus ibericus CBS 121593]|uniref:Uncharacterized protein n=1 Tax=Aspergillus ibericus CBS 121593 TaxID=1448316 RepID=A0A395HAG8_9EURO|nr:hypothetical protein BO80DRAFT_470879 [Aspergillus ibericus CBS 121593]RAL03194.1 hypothetical protein BO80DRAFT_470879 [Aspergillus ibericus CBS 121593]
MGIAESKMLAHKALAACAAVEKEDKGTLDHVSFWQDKEASRAAKKIIKHLPRHIRGTQGRQNAADRASTRRLSKIVVPDVVRDLKKIPAGGVGQKHLHNYTNTALAQDTALFEQLTLQCPLAGCYMIVVDTEKKKDLNIIRLRLLYVLFHRLNLETQRRFGQAVSDRLAQIIHASGLVTDTLETVEGRLGSWIDRGARYELLANDLGGLGVLFVLPDDVPESVWVKDLPKNANNKRRISMLQMMEMRDVNTASEGFNEIADAEIRNLWDPIMISINAVMELPPVHCPDPGWLLSGDHRLKDMLYHGSASDQNEDAQELLRYTDERDLASWSRNNNIHLHTMTDYEQQNLNLSAPCNADSSSEMSLLKAPAEDPSSRLWFPDTTSSMASFNILPDQSSRTLYSSSRCNVYHDLESFAMFPNLSSEPTQPLFPSEVYHNLASFAVSTNPSSYGFFSTTSPKNDSYFADYPTHAMTAHQP